MKRYVKEIANEFLKVEKYPEEDKQKIQKIINFAERGLITSMEAVRMILKVDEDLQIRDAELEELKKQQSGTDY